MKRLANVLLTVLLSGCVTTVDRSTSFTQTAGDGMVLLELTNVPVGRADIALINPFICPFPIGARKPAMDALHGCPHGELLASSDAKTTVVAYQMPTGRYVLERLQLQGRWAACFNGGTVAFNVVPGQVTYLGSLDVRPHMLEVAVGTPMVAYAINYHTVFDAPRPALRSPLEIADWQRHIQAFLSANLPMVTAPLVSAVTEPVTFDTGQALIGRVCTGALE